MVESRPLIMVVDDNEDIVTNVKIFLEFNEFDVITASNGKEALDILFTLDKIPDVIVSDIMMPEMDGYDFFKSISAEARFAQVPFIFLSAKFSPEDIRLGKILGADDYMTKPFNPNDLLDIINAKITRNKNTTRITEIVENRSKDIQVATCYEESRNMPVYLMHVIWDDHVGPMLKAYCPKNENMPFKLEDIGFRLFNASQAIYGEKFSGNAEGFVLTLEYIHQQGYLFFDSYKERSNRSGVFLFMLCAIHPCITYFNSLSIRKVFEEISELIKSRKEVDLATYLDRITELIVG